MGIASKIVKGGLEAVAKKARRAKDLERKAAEAYAQMPEYLQDPYLGLSTSNIGKITKSVLAKTPRKSKAVLEAEGYYHPIGGSLKLSKPAQEFTANIVEDPTMPLVPKILRSPEELYGKVGIPFVGDRSDTGKLLRGIEGVDFDKAIKLEGGHKFGRAHQYEDPNVSSVWASDPDIVTSLLNQVRRAGESGKDVLGISSMGSPKMVDFNTMVTKGTLNMTDMESLSREAIEEFNNELRNKVVKNKKTGKVTTPFKEFLGIDHPEISTQLLSQDKGTGELRKAFISIMDKDKYRKLGFPEIAPIRKAVTDPEILDMPLGSTGLEIYKMSPEGKIIEAPKNPHSTYPMHMQGEYFGGLETPIDYKDMFSTFYEPKKLMSVKDPQAYRAYSLSAPIQEFDQKWLDEVMPIYQQNIKDITGRKKGGEIHPDGSARLANGASARKTVDYLLKDQSYGVGGKVAKELGKKIAKEATEISNAFKKINFGDIVSGNKVRDEIPNRSSIGASLYDYKIDGVQEVPMSAFEVQGKPKYRSVEEENHTKNLANQIKENKELNPLIVVKDKDGYYVLEGAHRFDALRELDTPSFPALVVHDVESLSEKGYGAGGKVLTKGLKLLEDVAKKVKLPPASNSARTQIVGTMPTYEKARDILGKEGIKGSDIIDFGAGKGLGSTAMKAHSFEPYPQGWYPTYTKSEDIPSEKYKGLLNLNVLNVLDPEMRAHTVKEIGRVMQPEGGTGLITTRGRDVLNTIGGKAGNEPMSVITSRDTYQKGFEPEELRSYIKYILGSDFEYEPLNLGPAGVKIKKKADGGTIGSDAEEYGQQLKEQRKTLASDVLKSGKRGITEGLGNIYQSAKETLSRAGTFGDIVEGYGKYATPIEKARYEGITGTKVPEFKPVPYLPEQSITESPVGAKMMPLTTGGQQFAGEVIGDPLSYSMSGAGRGLKKVGKFLAEGIAEAEATGKGPVGKVMQTIVPRMNIIKDPGGMLIGGEKALDNELLYMKKTENAYPYAQANFVTDQKDTEAQALNNWIDTKVRKYLRNQAGSKDDPILKSIESGVDHNFTPPQSGDTKYTIAMKRKVAGKDPQGIATTEKGKDWEYAVDATFDPVKSKNIKEILNDPMEHADATSINRRKASILRMEQNLPIQDEADFEALKLINQIPDEHVYTLNGSNITERLGLNHVSDVLYEDLRSGKLTPEQLNQMSMEKAIRRTAEYDAEKAKAMNKANASSVEGMPVPKAYDDGFKWVELKHETDPKKTQVALKSEGEMMGHCVGGYCPEVESGEIKIYSLRSPDGKSHVTIEARPQFSMSLWRNANIDAINSNPKLKEYDFQMRSLDNDHKYGHRMTEQDYVREMTKEMKKLGINSVEPPSYMELHQVKGKQNKRPDDKYQNYISDFIKNNPTKHEIVDVFELGNTNLMNVQDIADTGLVNKDIHIHPEVEKAVKKRNAEYGIDPEQQFDIGMQEEHKYDLFKEVARDLARQNKTFLDKDDILNHIREKYLTLPKKKSGGLIDLQQEYKLENMRRRYG